MSTREWEIQGDYGQGWELVTGGTSWKEIKANMRDYRENEPGVPFRYRTPDQVKARERSRLRRQQRKEQQHVEAQLS